MMLRFSIATSHWSDASHNDSRSRSFMWWRLAIAGVALGLIAIIGTDPGPGEITTVQQRPVTIATMPCASSLQTTSSGFVIDDGIVVTVAHAIYESREFAVRDWVGRWHVATIQHMDLERDLAVLAIAELNAEPMALTEAMAGDAVYMLDGAASGEVAGEVLRRVNISTEVIGDLERKSRRSGYELSVEIVGGDSGAAVVDDEGELVAVVFARSTRREASWATSAAEVDEIRDRRNVPTWDCSDDSGAPLVLDPPEPRLP